MAKTAETCRSRHRRRAPDRPRPSLTQGRVRLLEWNTIVCANIAGRRPWARVRQAYIAGESAPSLVRRFDVGYANLRRRARIEGWTRKDIAAGLDMRPVRGEADGPPPAIGALPDLDALSLHALPEPPLIPPRETIAKAVRRAAWLVSEGKAAEAAALLRAAEVLERLAWAAT